MSKKSKYENGSAAGFTLVELLFVAAIGMIMAGMAIPAARSAIASYQLDAAADSAAGAIQGTRYQAIMHGYPYQVDFDATANTYQVYSEAGTATTFSTVGSAVPISAVQIAINAGSTNHVTLQFKPNGAVTVSSGQTTPVSFTISYNGTTKTLTVSNYGSVSVQ